MAKNDVRSWDSTASNNTDIAGIGIQGTNLPSNFDNALRTVMAQIADVDGGVQPVNDTWTFCDPSDTTKRGRFDCVGVTTATTRVYTMPDFDGYMTLGPSSTTDNTIPRFDSTAGKLQTSGVVINDSDVVISAATVSGTSAAVQSYTAANQIQAYGSATVGVLIHNTSATGDGFLTFGDGAVAGRVAYSHNTNTLTLQTGAGTTVATLNTTIALQVNGQSDVLGGKNFEVKDSAGNSDFWVRGDGLTFALGSYNSTTASAADVAFSGTGALQRSTSALKYKTDIQPITSEALAKFKQLEGITYLSLCGGDDKDRRFSGVIADQAHELGLHDLVVYGGDGEVEGFAYSRCAAYFLEWNKEIERRIAEINE